ELCDTNNIIYYSACCLFNHTSTTVIYILSLHDALPIYLRKTREAISQFASALLLKPDFPDALDRLSWILATAPEPEFRNGPEARSEEHTSELQSLTNLVCRLLLEKKHTTHRTQPSSALA